MSLLGRITTGPIDRPPRLLIYGEAGVGKSTFAAGFPDALFLDAERRTEHLDVSRIEVTSWDDVLGTMREVVKGDQLPYKTLVFDTVDHMELLVYNHVCREDGSKSIEFVGGGYGKGYTLALDEWRRFIAGLEKLRAKGITCILLAHGHVKLFKNPGGEDYDKWQLKMNAKAANFLVEKMDAVGFAHFEDLVAAKDSRKATYTGDRVLAFGHNAAYYSKQGIDLPDELELSYEVFKEARDGE
jgi:hypothetical protein